MSLLKYQWPAILWAFVILTLCAIKLNSVDQSPLFFPGFDKLVHCGLFFVLVIFCGYGNIKHYSAFNFTILTTLRLFAIAVVYGGVIEVLQQYVFTWRSGDWNDLFADSLGAAMGAFSILMIVYASAKHKN